MCRTSRGESPAAGASRRSGPWVPSRIASTLRGPAACSWWATPPASSIPSRVRGSSTVPGAPRWPPNLPRSFARIYTAAITDVMDEMGLRRQTLPATIQPLSAGMRTAGYAFTVRGRAHSGSPRERDQTLRRFLGMLGAVPAESVLVLAAHDNVAAHEVLRRGERLVGTESRVRSAVRRGMTPLAAYQKFGSF